MRMSLRCSEVEGDEPRVSDWSESVLLRGEGNETVGIQFQCSINWRNCGCLAFLTSFDVLNEISTFLCKQLKFFFVLGESMVLSKFLINLIDHRCDNS